MKKKIITMTAVAFLLIGCNNNDDENTGNELSAENIGQEAGEAEPQKLELTTEQMVLGEWEYSYDMNGTPLEILLTLREDGTYSQSMGGNEGEGTWEFVDDEHIVVKNANIISKEGQKWQIVKSTPDELHIDWNVNKGEEKVLKFTRKK